MSKRTLGESFGFEDGAGEQCTSLDPDDDAPPMKRQHLAAESEAAGQVIIQLASGVWKVDIDIAKKIPYFASQLSFENGKSRLTSNLNGDIKRLDISNVIPREKEEYFQRLFHSVEMNEIAITKAELWHKSGKDLAAILNGMFEMDGFFNGSNFITDEKMEELFSRDVNQDLEEKRKEKENRRIDRSNRLAKIDEESEEWELNLAKKKHDFEMKYGKPYEMTIYDEFYPDYVSSFSEDDSDNNNNLKYVSILQDGKMKISNTRHPFEPVCGIIGSIINNCGNKEMKKIVDKVVLNWIIEKRVSFKMFKFKNEEACLLHYLNLLNDNNENNENNDKNGRDETMVTWLLLLNEVSNVDCKVAMRWLLENDCFQIPKFLDDLSKGIENGSINSNSIEVMFGGLLSSTRNVSLEEGLGSMVLVIEHIESSIKNTFLDDKVKSAFEHKLYQCLAGLTAIIYKLNKSEDLLHFAAFINKIYQLNWKILNFLRIRVQRDLRKWEKNENNKNNKNDNNNDSKELEDIDITWVDGAKVDCQDMILYLTMFGNLFDAKSKSKDASLLHDIFRSFDGIDTTHQDAQYPDSMEYIRIRHFGLLFDIIGKLVFCSKALWYIVPENVTRLLLSNDIYWINCYDIVLGRTDCCDHLNHVRKIAGINEKQFCDQARQNAALNKRQDWIVETHEALADDANGKPKYKSIIEAALTHVSEIPFPRHYTIKQASFKKHFGQFSTEIKMELKL